MKTTYVHSLDLTIAHMISSEGYCYECMKIYLTSAKINMETYTESRKRESEMHRNNKN